MKKIADVIEKVDLYLNTFKSKLKQKSDDIKPLIKQSNIMLNYSIIWDEKKRCKNIKNSSTTRVA